MARPKETYNKKQREVKKQQHLQEKRQRAEERKAEKKSGNLEDMMAYLDENGNITSTPPDPSRKKVEIALEDIQISPPKLEDLGADGSDLRRRGKVSFFNRNKGYGFIQAENGGERLFFHVQHLNEDVNEGDQVLYQPGRGPRGMQAMDISKPTE